MQITDYPPATRIFFETAREALIKLNVDNTCERTGACYDASRGHYAIPYLGCEAWIDAQNAAMQWDRPITSLFHITLLHYLIYADGSKPKGDWISLYDAAPNGSTRVNHMLKANIPPLISVFADDMNSFFENAEKIGGEKISDSSIVIRILPNIPVQITIWPKDDEFPADARILLDKTIRGQLTAEDIVYVADVAVQALVVASGKPYHFTSI